MACSRAVLGTLVVGSLGINGNVHRKGTVNDTAGDLALGVHLAQLVGIDGAGHLRVDDLNSASGATLGHSTPQAWATATVFSMICTLSSSVG